MKPKIQIRDAVRLGEDSRKLASALDRKSRLERPPGASFYVGRFRDDVRPCLEVFTSDESPISGKW